MRILYQSFDNHILYINSDRRIVNSLVLEGHNLMRILIVLSAICVNVTEKTQTRNIRGIRSVWLTVTI
jgi:hypothetical protein